MGPTRTNEHSGGFTLVELLISVALTAVVTAILGLAVFSLIRAKDGQEYRLNNEVAVRRVMRDMAHELMAAYRPPDTNRIPFSLETSTETGQPETILKFHTPSIREWGDARWYDIEHVTYEVKHPSANRRQLYRQSAPCSGPYADADTPILLLDGPFTFHVEAVTNQTLHTVWPIPENSESAEALPQSVRLTLTWKDTPIQTDILIQAAHSVSSSVIRAQSPTAAETNQAAEGTPGE